MFSTGIETEKSLPAVTGSQTGSQTNVERSAKTPGRLDELLVAEILLVQATIESASALGDGIQAARNLRGSERRRELARVFHETRQQVVKPYSERLSFLRQLRGER